MERPCYSNHNGQEDTVVWLPRLIDMLHSSEVPVWRRNYSNA